MHPTPRHAASHVRCVGARGVPGGGRCVLPVIRYTAMFCPNCGASEQKPDAYCKKCGTYLRNDSFRGRLLGANNPERAAWLILFSSVFIAALCVCISLLIIRAESSGVLASLKY